MTGRAILGLLLVGLAASAPNYSQVYVRRYNKLFTLKIYNKDINISPV